MSDLKTVTAELVKHFGNKEKVEKTIAMHIIRFPHHANLFHVLARVVKQKFEGGKRKDHLGREIENYRLASIWNTITNNGGMR